MAAQSPWRGPVVDLFPLTAIRFGSGRIVGWPRLRVRPLVGGGSSAAAVLGDQSSAAQVSEGLAKVRPGQAELFGEFVDRPSLAGQRLVDASFRGARARARARRTSRS